MFIPYLIQLVEYYVSTFFYVVKKKQNIKEWFLKKNFNENKLFLLRYMVTLHAIPFLINKSEKKQLKYIKEVPFICLKEVFLCVSWYSILANNFITYVPIRNIYICSILICYFFKIYVSSFPFWEIEGVSYTRFYFCIISFLFVNHSYYINLNDMILQYCIVL